MNQVKLFNSMQKDNDKTIILELDDDCKIACEFDTDYITLLFMTHLEYKCEMSSKRNFAKRFKKNEKAICEIICNGIINGLEAVVNKFFDGKESINETIAKLNLIDLEATAFAIMLDEVTNKALPLLK